MSRIVQNVTAISPGSRAERNIVIEYTLINEIGRGSFARVYLAKIVHNNEDVAIKKVLQDNRLENRELQIMRRLEHRNVVNLKYFFYCSGDKKDEVYLNLILEFVPATVFGAIQHHTRQRQIISVLYIKIYMYQLFRALGYIHSIGICHRDIKPQNLLLNPQTSVLKLCDFGSAKMLRPGEENLSDICTHFYRAPELFFGAKYYTTKIDLWSAGTVLAELLLGLPFFPGSVAQTRGKIFHVLGAPSEMEIREMNPQFVMVEPLEFTKRHHLSQWFNPETPPDSINLLEQLLKYSPSARPNPYEVLAHDFFDDLLSPTCIMPNGRPLPQLFDFTQNELRTERGLNNILQRKNARRREAATANNN